MKNNNLIENELETIENEIREDLLQKRKLKERIHQIKNRILAIIMFIVAMTIIVPMTLVLVDLLVPAKISLMLLLTASITNTIIGSKKINQVKKEIEVIKEEVNYLNETKKKIEQEIKKDQNKNITIDYINKNYNWKDKIKLMRTYISHEKDFIKRYIKGDLYELLQESGYNNQETYYLYNRTQNEVEKANKQKVLKKAK